MVNIASGFSINFCESLIKDCTYHFMVKACNLYLAMSAFNAFNGSKGAHYVTLRNFTMGR